MLCPVGMWHNLDHQDNMFLLDTFEGCYLEDHDIQRKKIVLHILHHQMEAQHYLIVLQPKDIILILIHKQQQQYVLQEHIVLLILQNQQIVHQILYLLLAVVLRISVKQYQDFLVQQVRQQQYVHQVIIVKVVVIEHNVQQIHTLYKEVITKMIV